MIKFDGTRWTDFVTGLDYGLGGPWPLAGAPQSKAVYVHLQRARRGQPDQQLHARLRRHMVDLDPGRGAIRWTNTSKTHWGRLWGAGHTWGTWILENGNHHGGLLPKRLMRAR